MADDYSRVSQGGEGRIRRVTPEENRRRNIEALKARRSDTRQQSGWDLAMEQVAQVVARLEAQRDESRTEFQLALQEAAYGQGSRDAWLKAEGRISGLTTAIEALRGGEDG